MTARMFLAPFRLHSRPMELLVVFDDDEPGTGCIDSGTARLPFTGLLDMLVVLTELLASARQDPAGQPPRSAAGGP